MKLYIISHIKDNQHFPIYVQILSLTRFEILNTLNFTSNVNFQEVDCNSKDQKETFATQKHSRDAKYQSCRQFFGEVEGRFLGKI